MLLLSLLSVWASTIHCLVLRLAHTPNTIPRFVPNPRHHALIHFVPLLPASSPLRPISSRPALITFLIMQTESSRPTSFTHHTPSGSPSVIPHSTTVHHTPSGPPSVIPHITTTAPHALTRPPYSTYSNKTRPATRSLISNV
ncbi:hypothetical protein E2C01_044654 [Portunus trituberculatus]|uniref:Secreted protein n=1 Tax=Portunus trituberculatus TaxID=210409 RepID=A0A5B7FTP6_PORTR|nr:hypothetical protein [Portunus trituberculatus]